MFALHTDAPHLHVYITVDALGFDHRRLYVGKDTAQEWRETFVEALQRQGIDAKTTPRRSRSVVRKPDKQVILRIERGEKTHKPRVSKIRALKIKEAAEEITFEANGQTGKNRP